MKYEIGKWKENKKDQDIKKTKYIGVKGYSK